MIKAGLFLLRIKEILGPIVQWLGHEVFDLATGVRFSLGLHPSRHSRLSVVLELI